MKLQNLIHILIGIVCIALPPTAHAISPAPDGGYPGGNTAEGQNALFSLTTGGFNTALGFLSLRSNATGQFNTAIGAGTLFASTADANTANGAGALLSNTTGPENTANGAFALFSNTTGFLNTATGFEALLSNTTGGNNTAIGWRALSSNMTGGDNIALGRDSGFLLTTGSGNICIGPVSGAADESDTTRISNIYNSVASGRAVYVNSDHKLGTLSSSRRYKEEIKPMDKASETLFGLKPVTFRYKKEVDSARALSFGLIAEDVGQISPELITRDEKGNPQTVRYDQVNAMLLNEFLKEHRKNEEQQKQINALTAQLEEQAAQIQKVSAQLAAASPSRGGLEASKFATGRIRRGGTAPQIVLDNQ